MFWSFRIIHLEEECIHFVRELDLNDHRLFLTLDKKLGRLISEIAWKKIAKKCNNEK